MRVSAQVARKLQGMRAAGRIVRATLDLARELATPGRRTEEIDAPARELILAKGGTPLFLGYRGFPATICVSINEEVVHGIPGKRRLVAGDIVSVDVGVRRSGWCADAASTFPVGETSEEARRLVATTEEALRRAIEKVRPGLNLAEVSGAIQSCAESAGFSVVRRYAGHAIGRQMHEQPQVPNFVDGSLLEAGIILKPGMALAIEPMINAGGSEVEGLADGWTVVTRDRRLSAHFEHTVAATEAGPEVLTA